MKQVDTAKIIQSALKVPKGKKLPQTLLALCEDIDIFRAEFDACKVEATIDEEGDIKLSISGFNLEIQDKTHVFYYMIAAAKRVAFKSSGENTVSLELYLEK